MTNPGPERRDRTTVIGDYELKEMLRAADRLKSEVMRLRTRALIALFRLTGKRRSEVCRLEVKDFNPTPDAIEVSFVLSKKRKVAAMSMRATKVLPRSDPLTREITRYLIYLGQLKPVPRYFLPRLTKTFSGDVVVSTDSHIGGRQCLNLIRVVSLESWPHLFRETVGASIVAEDPTLLSAFKVMQRLDLSDIQTGFRYFTRWSKDVIDRAAMPESSMPGSSSSTA